MKSALVLLSLFVTGLRAAPQGIVPHVINGTPQIVQHAAAVVAIMNDAGEGFFGGGSIISDRHILTGANLISGAIRCRVGYGGTTFATLTIVTSTTFVSHAAFNRTTLDHDIAIVFLPFADRITFSDDVRAIALPTSAPAAGLEGSLGGFGFTQSNAETYSDTLLVANLVTAENSVCTARFPTIPFTTQFCANGRASVIPGLISNICAGDNGAGFYTGDGMITTTTTTTTTTTPDPETTTVDPGAAGSNPEPYTGDSDDPDMLNGDESAEILDADIVEINADGGLETEQVEPELIGVASAIGNFWECNPADPRGYTIVFNYISWIQDLTGIEV